MRRLLTALWIVLALAPAMVFAQEKEDAKRRFGLTFPNLGVIWHITPNIAFLPDISLGHNWSTLTSSSDVGSSISTDNTNNTVGVNAALRFYIQEWKGVRFFLTPRYSYGWSNMDLASNGPSAITTGTLSTTNTHSVSASWGVQYPITNRLSIFGDIGARYSHGTSDASNQQSTFSGNSTTNQKSNGVFTVGTWGLILYLK